MQPLQPSQSRYQPNQDRFISYRPGEKKSAEGPPTKRIHHEVDARLLPCCLCTSPSEDKLLPVNDPPFPYMGVPAPKTADGTVLWRAHEECAMTIPETWVDEVDGQKRVFGVDGIIKDRWNLVSILEGGKMRRLLRHFFFSAVQRALHLSSRPMVLQFNVPRGNAPKLSTSTAPNKGKATQAIVFSKFKSLMFLLPWMLQRRFPLHRLPTLSPRQILDH